MSSQRWEFGTIVEHADNYNGDATIDITAMVVLDKGDRVEMISLDGPLPDRDPFYARGEVWCWSIHRGYWTVVDGR